METVEPALCFACGSLSGTPPAGDEAYRAVLACRTYLGLYRPPTCEAFNPATIIKARLQELEDESHPVEVEPVHDCVGDSQLVFDCLRILVRGALLGEGAALVTEVFEQKDLPSIALSFDGPGRFPDLVPIEGFLEIPFEDLCVRWTLATHGGRIEKAPNGLLLRLSGVRMLPPVSAEGEPLRAIIEQAVRAYPDRMDEVAGAVDRALAILDGDVNRLPADLNVLLSEVISERHRELTRRSIVPETLPDTRVPPIAIHRTRFRAFLTNVVKMAERSLPSGGALTVLLDYDRPKRAAELAFGITGNEHVPPDRCLAASLRRTAIEIHRGALDISEERNGVTITARFPDTVGQEVDAWIPGFEAFTERSRQALRLLKSGGVIPPADLLLAGVLDEELERWLLPKLTDSVVMNLAHSLAPGQRALPGLSLDRLTKALDQIKRGKPRKEITKPAYAAEILYAFRVEERHRKAVGAEQLGVTDIERLCSLLLQAPPNYVECLRLIARARS